MAGHVGLMREGRHFDVCKQSPEVGVMICNFEFQFLSEHMRHLFLALLLIVGVPGIAQIPKLKVDVPANMEKFVLKSYEVLDITMGDLNRDAHQDAIMVLYKSGEEQSSDIMEHPEKRPLLILLGQQDGSYKLASRSDNAVYCVDGGGQMGDPFTGISIKKGYFSVEHYGGSGQRWERIVTFKYNPPGKNWLVHKDGHEYFHATRPEEVSTKIETVKNFGTVTFEKFNIYKEK